MGIPPWNILRCSYPTNSSNGHRREQEACRSGPVSFPVSFPGSGFLFNWDSRSPQHSALSTQQLEFSSRFSLLEHSNSSPEAQYRRMVPASTAASGSRSERGRSHHGGRARRRGSGHPHRQDHQTTITEGSARRNRSDIEKDKNGKSDPSFLPSKYSSFFVIYGQLRC